MPDWFNSVVSDIIISADDSESSIDDEPDGGRARRRRRVESRAAGDCSLIFRFVFFQFQFVIYLP